MKIRKRKFAYQLLLNAIMSIFIVIIIGWISFKHTSMIHDNNHELYEHSLVVRRAVGELKSNVLSIHRNMKDLFLFPDVEQVSLHLEMIEVFEANAYKEIETIYSGYLGDKSDVDSVKKAFVKWNAMREETIRLMWAGKHDEAALRTRSDGVAGSQVEKLIGLIENVSRWSIQNADIKYRTSIEQKAKLDRHLYVIVFFMLILSTAANLLLLRNIRRPLNKFKEAADRIRTGDFSARSEYFRKDEFGVVSQSINALAEVLQKRIENDQRTSDLAIKMLRDDDPDRFFTLLLSELGLVTGSHTAVIYVLNDETGFLECLAAIGTEEPAKKSFHFNDYDGEFGIALSSRKIHHLKEVPADTRFVFTTINGTFIPREIVTIPIIAGGDIMACISLASVHGYGEEMMEWLDSINTVLSARIAGIMAYRNMRRLGKALEVKNRELEMQKSELEYQSAELEQQNLELHMQKEQLNEANRHKTTFLSNMSHELRTPLNSVIALSGVLFRRLAGKISDEEQNYLQVIERNGRRLLEIINDILDISRIESGKVDVVLSEFMVKDLIDEVVSLIKPQAENKKIKLSFTKGCPDVYMISDYKMCFHILQNLIGNAVKFTEKGKVTIAASCFDNQVFIEVKDTGVGIPADQIDHIFDEFRQADQSTTRKHEGTGLGLAIGRKFSQILGGKIAVESKEGKGSVFTLKLPVRFEKDSVDKVLHADREGITVSSAASQSSGTSGKSIMLVEDSEPAIVQICDILSEERIDVVVARNGEEALDMISVSIPDAVILDLMMPGIDGFEVLRSLRENRLTETTPILILTAKHITRDELSFLKKNNIYQLIYKGDVSRDRLIDAIRNMIRTDDRNTGSR